MNEHPKPSYVGVSGVVSTEMQTILEDMGERVGLFQKDRILALGVKAVHKTQWLDVENKYGAEWYPVGEEAFANALRHDKANPHTIAVAQTYLDVAHVHDANYRTQFTQRILDRGEPWLQAIQFDMLPWHSDAGVWDFLEDVKEKKVHVFLQAHKNAMETLGPKNIVRQLGHYAHIVDYILFDASHGTGTRLDTTALEPFIGEAYESLDPAQTGIAIAGGLNGDIVREELPHLLSAYPRLSWDAEGQLHPVNKKGNRPLDISAVNTYLQASVDVLYEIV